MQCGIRETRYNRSIATYSAFFFSVCAFFFHALGCRRRENQLVYLLDGYPEMISPVLIEALQLLKFLLNKEVW